MVELFLNGYKVDIDDGIDIAITYKSTDFSNPTAVKNSFSKSVVLKGTKTNNEVFGQIYSLDRATMEGEDLYGVHFDARKRVDFILYENSDILEKGYFKLDSIELNGGEINYSITLYGQLGDFFYNLQYNEEGEDMTLADLYYGFLDGAGSVMSKERENGSICLWNKDFIHNGWTLLNGRETRDGQSGNAVFDSNDMHTYNWIVAAPAYNGENDDFSNDITLVKYDGVSGLPEVSESTLNNSKGWLKVEAKRDLVEWETRDLRSCQQRPAVKAELIFKAISNPENNGGYEVVWDNEITDVNTLYGKYYNSSYILFDRLDFDETSSKYRNIRFPNEYDCRIGNSYRVEGVEDYNIAQIRFYSGSTTSTTVDTTVLSNGYMSVDIQEKFISTLSNIKKKKFMTFNSYGYNQTINNKAFDKTVFLCYGCIGYRLKAVIDGEATYSPWTLVSNTDNFKEIVEYNGITDYITAKRAVKMIDEDYPDWFFWCDWSSLEEKPITVTMKKMPSDSNVEVYLEKQVFFSDAKGYQNPVNRFPFMVNKKDSFGELSSIPSSNGMYYSYSKIIDENTTEDSEYESGVYDSTASDSIQKMNLTKKVLFGSGGSPFEYLTSFSKMLDLRFRMDSALKRVYIERRQNYYIDEVYDLTKSIDLSQARNITPTITEYKWYKYGLETPESYAQYLYSKRNKVEYGNMKFNTGYNFNSEVNDIFEDNIFKNVIPYKLNSIYFNQPSNDYYCPATFSYDYKYTTFSSTLETSESGATGQKYVKSEYDSIPKLCCFDSDNGNMSDIDNAFIFYDGMRALRGNEFVMLTDNLKIMKELNDGACYIFGMPLNNKIVGYDSLDAVTQVEVAKTWSRIPCFSKYITDGYYRYRLSLDFTKPNNTFIDDLKEYSDGICIYDVNWKYYMENIYHKDCKSIELYTFLPEKPNSALRKFYYFADSYWLLDEVNDYSPTVDKPVKCKFVKLDDYKSIMYK